MKAMVLAAAVFLACSAGGAHAANSSAGLTQSASVEVSCAINVGTVIAFGKYDPLVAHKNSGLQSSMVPISFRCTQGAPMPTITLGQGNNFDSTGCAAYRPRRLRHSGTSYLYYTLSANNTSARNGASAQMPAACGTGYPPAQMNAALNSTYSPATNKSTDDVVFYVGGTIYSSSEVLAHRTAQAGNYSDSVMATITF